MSMEALEGFLGKIFKETEGYVYFPVRDRDGRFKNVFFQWPQHKASIARHCFKYESQGYEVYYSPVIYETPRPGKDNFKGSHVLWADYDGNAESVSVLTDRREGDPTGDSPAAAAGAPGITVRTSTAGRMHAYWVLDEFVTDRDAIESGNRFLAYETQADTGGWDANQLMRPPYTTNFGYTKPERKGKTYEVVVDEISSRVVAWNSFRNKVAERLPRDVKQFSGLVFITAARRNPRNYTVEA